MGAFILRRLFYSWWVIIGVVLFTFVLFRLAAGDPAAAVLGKNPSASDIEALRRDLGSDLPLFAGYECRTEAFDNLTFETEQLKPNIVLSGDYKFEQKKLHLNGGKLQLKRNFKTDEKLYISLSAAGDFKILPADNLRRNGSEYSFELAPKCEIIEIQGVGTLNGINIFRHQEHWYNSQFLNSISEICSFKSTFPYVSLLNFGQTLTTKESIRSILFRGVWPSLMLMVPIFLGELILAVALALTAAAFKGKLVDKIILYVSISLMSISYLVMIIGGQWLLGYYYNLFPVWGWDGVMYLILPMIVGIVSGLGGGIRFYRTVFVNELNREYLRTAAARGCSPWKIYTRHLLRNAAIPIIARATSILPFLFTGSLLLEAFFGIPGLGYTGIDALNNSDLQLLKALVILSALLFVTVNLIADIMYAWADPRIRLGRK